MAIECLEHEFETSLAAFIKAATETTYTAASDNHQ